MLHFCHRHFTHSPHFYSAPSEVQLTPVFWTENALAGTPLDGTMRLLWLSFVTSPPNFLDTRAAAKFLLTLGDYARRAGVDVMITIFCDFWQFSAKKLVVFFKKKQCYNQNFAYFSFVLSQKRQLFRWIFRQKYLKNHNIGPCSKAAKCIGLACPSGKNLRC
jgi:hypothetical protein